MILHICPKLLLFALMCSKGISQYVEEGSTYVYENNFSLQNLKNCISFEWYRRDSHILSCPFEPDDQVYLQMIPCYQQPSARHAIGQFILSGGQINLKLTIENIYRSKNESDEYRWELNCTTSNDSVHLDQFMMRIYHQPESIQCSITFPAPYVTARCSGEKIYPEVNAVLNLFLNQGSVFGRVMMCENNIDSSSLYYNSSCALSFDLGFLQIGLYRFEMSIFPIYSRLIKSENTRILNVNVEKPQISLMDSPFENINEGTTFSCTCQRSDHSDIPTNVTWLINGTQMSSSSNVTLVLTVQSSRYNTNYACVAVNLYNLKSDPIFCQPSVLYPAALTNFLINGTQQRPVVLDNGSTLNVFCEGMGNPSPSINLMKDRTQVFGPTDDNATLIWYKTVSCRDSGIYSCMASNFLGFSEKNFTVLIKCPQQLQDPSTNEQVLTGFEKGVVSVYIRMFGYPRPETFILMRNGENVFSVYGPTKKTDESQKYIIVYFEDVIPNGNVKLTISNMSLDDFSNYTLKISNGEKGNLDFSFSIKQSTPVKDEVNGPMIGAIVGGCVGVLVAIGLLTVCVLVMRYKDACKRKVTHSKDKNNSPSDAYIHVMDNTSQYATGIYEQAGNNEVEYITPVDPTANQDSMMNSQGSLDLPNERLQENIYSHPEVAENLVDGANGEAYDSPAYHKPNSDTRRTEHSDESVGDNFKYEVVDADQNTLTYGRVV